MEWHANPLLREEIEAVRKAPRALPPHYQWSAGAGVTLLAWKGQAVGAVHADGRYWLRWRRREHAGTAASRAQAMRFMARWLCARRNAAPLLDADLPPPTLVPLATFLREHEDWPR